MAFHDSFGGFREEVVFTADSPYEVRFFACFRAEHVLRNLLLGGGPSCLALGEGGHGREARVGWVDRVSLVVMHAVVAV